jgi:WD40 repeat protein
MFTPHLMNNAGTGPPYNVSALKHAFQQSSPSNIKTLEGHRKPVRVVNFNRTGSKLATGGIDSTVRIWSIRDHFSTPTHIYTTHTATIDSCIWSPIDDYLLATASADKTIKIFDTHQKHLNKHIHSIHTGDENINVCWSGDGAYTAVGTRSNLIHIIDMKKVLSNNYNTTNNTPIIGTHRWIYEINEIRFHTHNEDVMKKIHHTTLQDNTTTTATATTRGYDNNNNVLVVTSGTGNVEIWSFIPTFTLLSTIPLHTAPVYTLSFDPTGQYMVCYSLSLK